MSGGEQQRITIARQLMYQPELLLLDEATSALDDKNSAQVEQLIFDMVKNGTSVLWITHNKAQSERHFHRVITVRNGEIEKGRTHDNNVALIDFSFIARSYFYFL